MFRYISNRIAKKLGPKLAEKIGTSLKPTELPSSTPKQTSSKSSSTVIKEKVDSAVVKTTHQPLITTASSNIPTTSTFVRGNSFHSPRPTHFNKKRYLPFTTLFTLTSGAAYRYFQQKDTLIYPKDIAFTTLNDLSKQILNALGNAPEKEIKQMHCIIECIRENDVDLLATIFKEMKDENIFLPQDIIKHLVQLAAFQGKVNALNIISTYFGSDVITADPIAYKLIHHPSKADIQRISGEFVAGPGKIKKSGERTYLSYLQENISSNEKQDPDIYGLDAIEDTSVMFAFIKGQFQKNRISKKVADITVINQDPDALEKYLQAVKERSELLDRPLHCRFILAGAHFTFGDIVIKKQNGQNEAEIFYFDSLGGTAEFNPFEPYVSAALKIFPRTTFYSSEEKLQHSVKGCSLFTLLHTQLAVSADELLPHHSEKNVKTESLFLDYCKKHVTETVKTVYFDADNQPIDYHYHLIITPPNFSKQSFNSNGEITEFVLNETKKDYIERTVTRIGHMGINTEKENSETRRNEFKQPRLLTGESADELIEKHTEYVKGKPMNKAIDHLAKEAGPQLVLWMLEKSPEEIEEIKQEHTLKNFRAETQKLTSHHRPTRGY